jgi:hypothetical protein
MGGEGNWAKQLIDAVSQVGPIGVAALALVFGIGVVYMAILLLRR